MGNLSRTTIDDIYICNIKVTKVRYHWLLLLEQFRFCETHFTTYPRFVADQSAMTPFLGGIDLSSVYTLHVWVIDI